MGIPLPALDTRPPQQPEDPLSQYAKVLSLKNMMQQQQAGNIQLQQQQQALADQQAMTKAMNSWDGKDINALPKLILKNGGSAQAVYAAQTQLEQRRQQRLNSNKTQQELDDHNTDLILGKIKTLQDIPDAQFPQAFQQTLQDITQQNLADPQHLQQYAQLSSVPPAQAKKALELTAKMMMGLKYQDQESSKAQADAIARQKAQQEAALAPSQLQKSEADAAIEAAKAQAIQGGALPEDMAKAKYEKVLTDLASGVKVPQADLNFARAYEASQEKVSSTSNEFGTSTTNVSRPGGLSSLRKSGGAGAGGSSGGSWSAEQGVMGDDYLKTLNPKIRSLVEGIGTGHLPPERLGYILTRNPDLLAAVKRAYPDFDAAKAPAYIKAYQFFTSGKGADQLNKGATALGHLAELKKLNTTESLIPYTAAWTKYQNKVDTLASELAGFYGDSNIPAINSLKATLASNLPGNRDAAIETQAQSMGDKLDSFQHQWNNAAPSSAYEALFPGISDEAKKARAFLDPGYRPSSTPVSATSLASPKLKIGTIEDGYLFKGGDPADKRNWIKK